MRVYVLSKTRKLKTAGEIAAGAPRIGRMWREGAALPRRLLALDTRRAEEAVMVTSDHA